MCRRIWGCFRRRYQLPVFGLLLMIFALVPDAPAQGFLPARLNLTQAVEKALDANPQTKSSESRRKIAELRIKETKTGLRPVAELSQSVVRSNDPVFVFSSLLQQGRFTAANFGLKSLNDPNGMFNLRSSFSVKMPLLDQGQTRGRIDQAKIAKARVDMDSEAIRQRLRFDAIRGFYGTILAKEFVNVAADAVRSAAANSKKAKDMADVGMTTDADYLDALVELANARQQKIEAESSLITTLADLNLTLGERPEVEHEFVGDLQEKYFPCPDQATLIRTALDNRPDYLAAELAIARSQRETRAIKDTKLPRIETFGSVNYSSPYITNGSSDYTVGVSVSYSLFDAGRRYRIEQATEAENTAETEKQVLVSQITGEVVRSLQNYRTARAKIEVSIKSIAQAEEALQILQDRYKSGLSTFDRVVGSEAALVKAKHNLLTARYEYLIGYASVLLATGQLRDVRVFD